MGRKSRRIYLQYSNILIVDYFIIKSFAAGAVIFLLAAGGGLRAQAPCTPPLLPPLAPGLNIFTDQQEVDLGDAMAEHLQRNMRITDDPAVTGYLRQMGERLLRFFPPNNLHFQFYLLDIPYPNAFGGAGGRIYVGRKLAGFVRNEDELAGILAHEIGHVVAHHHAIETTQRLKDLLRVTKVGDRRDIYEKYHRLLDNWRRKPQVFRHGRKLLDDEQRAADQIGLRAAASAGYSLQSTADAFNRVTDSQGKTGNWLSDLFGTTRPEERRLREMIKAASALDARCISPAPAERAEAFQKWRAAVVEFTAWRHREALHDVIATTRLEPPLTPDLRQLRFSPDGRYLLAQDSGSIHLFSRDPLAVLFTIEAPDALPAFFTPDSASVAFHTQLLRVELWDIAGRKRTRAYEPVFARGCSETALAPDVRTMACLAPDSDLSLLDLPSGTEMFRKKDFSPFADTSDFFRTLRILLQFFGRPAITMQFSPDARYFVAVSGDKSLGFDLQSRQALSLPGSIKKALAREFVFLGSGRLLGMNLEDPQKSPLLRFPSGEVLDRVPLMMGQELAAPGHGNYVIVRPVRELGAGVLDFATKRLLVASKTPALDIYDEVWTNQRRSGGFCLDAGKTPRIEDLPCVNIPASALGGLRTGEVSPDLKWLALSGKGLGGVWNLETGKRHYNVRGFGGAYFAENEAVYVDFPKEDQKPRAMAWMDLTRNAAQNAYTIAYEFAHQHGRFLVVTLPGEKGMWYGRLNRNVTREFLDAQTGTLLWSRAFSKEAPSLYVHSGSNTAVLSWEATQSAVEDEIKAHSEWRDRLTSRPERDDNFLEVVDARTGKALGALLVPTGRGSFFIVDMFGVGDSVFVSDSENRVLVYSLSKGQEKGRVFGNTPEVSAAAGLMAVSNERDQLGLYDLDSLEQVDQFVFSSPVTLKRFSADGKRLLVVTADQVAYTLGLAPPEAPADAGAAPKEP